MASVKAHAIVQGILALESLLVTRICDPSVRLEEDSWTQVLFAVPPIRRARCAAACAEDALVKTIKLASVLLRLQILLAVCWCRVPLQVWLDRLVLLVELREIGYEVLDDVSVW